MDKLRHYAIALCTAAVVYPQERFVAAHCNAMIAVGSTIKFAPRFAINLTRVLAAESQIRGELPDALALFLNCLLLHFLLLFLTHPTLADRLDLAFYLNCGSRIRRLFGKLG